MSRILMSYISRHVKLYPVYLPRQTCNITVMNKNKEMFIINDWWAGYKLDIRVNRWFSREKLLTQVTSTDIINNWFSIEIHVYVLRHATLVQCLDEYRTFMVKSKVPKLKPGDHNFLDDWHWLSKFIRGGVDIKIVFYFVAAAILRQ